MTLCYVTEPLPLANPEPNKIGHVVFTGFSTLGFCVEKYLPMAMATTGCSFSRSCSFQVMSVVSLLCLLHNGGHNFLHFNIFVRFHPHFNLLLQLHLRLIGPAVEGERCVRAHSCCEEVFPRASAERHFHQPVGVHDCCESQRASPQGAEQHAVRHDARTVVRKK